MDWHQRFAKKRKMAQGVSHEIGFQALMFIFLYCYDLEGKHVTANAFSIDNFRRKPEEVQKLMDLMMEKMQLLKENESLLHHKQVLEFTLLVTWSS
ncbi:hypothetical protein SLA2020_159170 [Shorea laevis]